MNTVEAGVEGYAPVVEIGKAPRPMEKDLYRQVWKHPEYREVAPGEYASGVFMEQVRPAPGSSVIDFGCGTGRGSLNLAVIAGCNVTMVDFADNCLDEDIRPMLETQSHALRFIEADLTETIPATAQYGFCTDVMEHIPEGMVDRVLDNILHAGQKVFFQISCEQDVMGELVGHPLHLTVKPFSWWLDKFKEHDCTVLWSKDEGSYCWFYVTAWVGADTLVEAGVLNIEMEQVRKNVLTNVQAGYGQIVPHETNDIDVMILGGGPSLDLFKDEIIEMRKQGVKLITMNGAYNWCLENGLTPSAQVVVDARPFNARFTHPVVDKCRYLIASQCDPSVLDGLPPDQTLLWNTSCEDIQDILEEHCPEWYGIPGGSTVLLRTIPMFRMLGYRKFHLYGCDSCVSDDKHHAYSQPENDKDRTLPVAVGDRIFHCTTWQTAQAQEFMDLIKVLGNEFELVVHGDGLLAYILEHAAELATREDWLK